MKESKSLSGDLAIEETIFNAAVQLGDPAKRAAYLDLACENDPALRVRIDKLLGADGRDAFFAKPIADPALLSAAAPAGPASPPQKPGEQTPGDHIDRYKLLQMIAEGGCGVVYMAEQEEPVRRRVALKIIKAGMDTRSVIARFEAERQALALMDHPNIAKVHDAGATETGRPYFVMELVRGVKITDYCDEKSLSTRERLGLFSLVCHAIQHAHQKGIIHRDIKPSNVLVTVNDGIAVPKVIDFGIAKATTDQRLTDKTVFTAFEQFVGTPAYMSPEQAEITSLDIDTRSDIYSLGVLLYELLTGKTPFDPKELLQVGLDEMRRTIREVEPVKPSTRLTQELSRFASARRKVGRWESEKVGSAAKPAQETHSPTFPRAHFQPGLRLSAQDLQRLIPALRGDLDWIVMKCLEKDRARRYETANGLASDIQRHLNNEPVMACPPSNLYRFQKMVRRNKVAFAASAGIAAALVLGLCVATWGLVCEREARNRAVAAEQAALAARTHAEANAQKAQASEQQAQTEALKSRQVAQFLAEMFHGVGPAVALGRDTTLLKAMLDKAVERLGKVLTNQPEVAVELLGNLAWAYDELGLYREEAELTRRSLELARARFPAESDPVAEALFQMARALNSLGQLKEAEAAARESVAVRRKLLAAQRGDALRSTNAPARQIPELQSAADVKPEALYSSLSQLGYVLYNQREYEQAEITYREALALARKLHGDEHEDVATQLSGLGLTLWQKDDLFKAEESLREALAINRKLYGTNAHPYLSASLNNLALVLKSQGQLTDAEALYLESLEMMKKVDGAEHRDIVLGLHNLASLARAQKRLAVAESRERDAVAMARKLGNDDRVFAQVLGRLGEILRDERKFDEAYEAVSESLALRRESLGNDNVEVAYSLLSLTTILDRQGKMADAEPLCREYLAIYQTKTPDHWHAFEGRALLGAALLAQKKYNDAESLLLSGYEGMKQREHTAPKAIRPELKPVLEDLVKFYTETGRADQAAEWKQKLAEFEKEKQN